MFQTTQTGTKKFTATVTNVDDPEKRGRIKVTCPALLGDDTTEFKSWVEPEIPMGWFLIPEVGRQVTISISSGSNNDTVSGQSMITAGASWSAEIYTDDDGSNPAPQEFTAQNYSKRRGFKTPAGHVFLFDDTKAQEQVTLSWSGGSKSQPKTSFLSLDKSGSIVAQDASGSLLYLNGGNGESSLVNKSGAYLTLGENGISMVDTHGNAFVTGADGISLVSNGPIGFAGSDHVFQSGLHFVDGALTVNVGGLASSFHPATTNGVAFGIVTNASVAIPGDPTFLDHLLALQPIALL